MPRNQTAPKQGEEFISKVSDKMVEARFMELYPAQILQEMFASSPGYKSRLLAYIRAVIELEEINLEIEDVRAKHGIEASLVNIGPRGGRTLTPLQRLRRTKVNQVLRKYRSINTPTEWMILSGVGSESFSIGAMPQRGIRSRAPTRIRRRKPAKKRATKKSSSRRTYVRGLEGRGRLVSLKGSAPRPPRGDPLHDSEPSRGKSEKSAPITDQDIASTIKAVEKELKSKALPPEKRATFQAALLELKNWKKDWRSLIKIARDTKLLLGLGEDIVKLIEFLKSLL